MLHIPPDSRSVRDGSPGLYATLADRARRATHGALTAAAAVGVLTILALTLWRPAWWMAALPLVSVGAFGWWGIIERERVERHAVAASSDNVAPRVLHLVQAIVAAVGTTAALLAAFALLGLLFGTVIS